MAARKGYVDFRGYRTWYRFVGDLNSVVLAGSNATGLDLQAVELP